MHQGKCRRLTGYRTSDGSIRLHVYTTHIDQETSSAEQEEAAK